MTSWFRLVRTHGPPHHDHACALEVEVITIEIETYAMHLDCLIAIQGEQSDAFYNASRRASSERFIKDMTAALHQGSDRRASRWTISSEPLIIWIGRLRPKSV